MATRERRFGLRRGEGRSAGRLLAGAVEAASPIDPAAALRQAPVRHAFVPVQRPIRRSASAAAEACHLSLRRWPQNADRAADCDRLREGQAGLRSVELPTK
jgi:hypothetical protein